jgi:hypothetical protein
VERETVMIYHDRAVEAESSFRIHVEGVVCPDEPETEY